MTVGMGMRMAITMGTKKHIWVYLWALPFGYSHGHAYYISAVPITLSIGTLEIHNLSIGIILQERGYISPLRVHKRKKGLVIPVQVKTHH